MMEDSNEANAITTISKDSNLQLSLLSSSQYQLSSSSIKLAIRRKDERLEFLNIPKGI